MSKLLYLGMPMDEVIATVTSNPARMLGMADTLGSLQVGREADISAFDHVQGRFTLSDNSGARVTVDEMLAPAFCLRAGRMYRADSPLVPLA
ncbi:amidohydrolase family protein [Komagataeibacter rhaeticus]|nr:amidohydrolase family protein [Komagataeibacter rhaeticus]